MRVLHLSQEIGPLRWSCHVHLVQRVPPEAAAGRKQRAQALGPHAAAVVARPKHHSRGRAIGGHHAHAANVGEQRLQAGLGGAGVAFKHVFREAKGHVGQEGAVQEPFQGAWHVEPPGRVHQD